VRTRLTAPSKLDCGDWKFTVIVMEDPAVKAIGVVGSTETIEKPGVETDMELIESGGADVPAVSLKEYQNCSP